ncbi:MAG: DNA cytosine methyltransferase [Coprobacillaceae bacterium]
MRIDNLISGKEIDIIIGGPPCQAYSVIGRSRDSNKMMGDKRKYLYKEYIKYLSKYSPKMYIFENVTGILSSTDEKGRKMLDKIKRAFNYVGYNFQYMKLNSKDFGVLQDRERVLIIGWKKEYSLEFPKINKTKLQQGSINQLFNDLPSLNSNENQKSYSYKKQAGNTVISRGIREANWKTLTQHNARYNNSSDLQIYKILQQEIVNKGLRLSYKDLPSDLKTHKNQQDFQDRFKVINGKGVSHTMVAHIAKDGHHYIHPDIKQNRSITVREAARIQSFPDNYYFESSRTAAFTQIGNAVPPLMAEALASACKWQLKKSLKEDRDDKSKIQAISKINNNNR